MRIRPKILTTAVAGGFTYLLTELTGQPEIWQLTMTVFVGGVTLVVQFLIEAADQSRRTTEVVARMNNATALFARADEHVSRSVAALAETAARLEHGDDLRTRFATHETGRLTRLYDGLRRGSAEYEGEDRDWLLGLTETATTSIDATSIASFVTGRVFVDEELWGSDLGLRYLARQQQAIGRGVRVRRLFLLDEGVDGSDVADGPQIAALLAPHKDISVETRVLRSTNVKVLIQTNLADFILFDDTIGYEIESAPSMGTVRPVIARTMLIIEQSRVAERRARFETMWANAEDP